MEIADGEVQARNPRGYYTNPHNGGFDPDDLALGG
jgi:hypothetical protein